MLDIFKMLFGGGEQTDLAEVMNSKPFLVDVRSPMEFNQGHPKGSINIPLDRLDANLSKFKGKDNIVVFCRSGARSGQAKSILESHGITNVVNGGPWENVAKYTN
ncbi:MAG: rhodanese-like domain-containing protein [Saprospiraceae bacterium]